MSLEGNIREIRLVERIVELAKEQFTGAIRFERESVIKIIYFKDGTILSASTNDRGDSIDEILLNAGKLTREHVKQALARRKESETLGDALLTLGFITRKELGWARRIQLVGIIRSILGWDDGTFTIVHDYLPKREEGTAFNAAQIIVELLVTDEERTAVEQSLDHGELILRKSALFDEEYARLDLNADADEIVLQVDGQRSALEIAALTSIDAFAVFKLLNALRVLGLLESPEPHVSHEVSSPAFQPSFDEPVATLRQPQVSFNFEAAPPEPAFPSPPAPVFPKTNELTVDPDLLKDPVEFESLPAIDDHASYEPYGDLDEKPADAQPLSLPTKRTRKTPYVVALVLAVILLGGGFAAWKFLLNRDAGEPEPVAAQKPAAAATVQTMPATTTAAPVETTSTIAAPVTTEPANVQSPPVAETKPAPAAVPPLVTTTAPAPKTQPKAVEATPVSNDPVRARYDAMAAAFVRERKSVAYAVQFELVCQTDSVTRALANGGDQVWFIPIQYKGRACFRMLYGDYATRDAAEGAIDGLPAALRSGSKPAPVNVAQLVK